MEKDSQQFAELAADVLERGVQMISVLQASGLAVVGPEGDPRNLLALNLLGPTIQLAMGHDPTPNLTDTINLAKAMDIQKIKELFQL